jgi:hypothetical protein
VSLKLTVCPARAVPRLKHNSVAAELDIVRHFGDRPLAEMNFLDARRDEFGIDKGRDQHTRMLAPWSTLCRANWAVMIQSLPRAAGCAMRQRASMATLCRSN